MSILSPTAKRKMSAEKYTFALLVSLENIVSFSEKEVLLWKINYRWFI